MPNGKEEKDMIYALIEYINKYGRVSMKSVQSEKELTEFQKKLDERIAKGTCGGYLITVL